MRTLDMSQYQHAHIGSTYIAGMYLIASIPEGERQEEGGGEGSPTAEKIKVPRQEPQHAPPAALIAPERVLHQHRKPPVDSDTLARTRAPRNT